MGEEISPTSWNYFTVSVGPSNGARNGAIFWGGKSGYHMMPCTTFTWNWGGYTLTLSKHKKYFLQKCMQGSILSVLIKTAHCSTISNSSSHFFLSWKWINGPFYDFPTLSVARLMHSSQTVNSYSLSFMSVLQFALFSPLHIGYLSVFFFSPPPDFW